MQEFQFKAKTSVFAESCIPPLLSGEYTLSVNTKTNALGESQTHEQEIIIEGPRFNLIPQDIHSVYPPSGMEGSFGLSLPHVVFTRRTLPWERSLDGQKTGEIPGDGGVPVRKEPWLALLLFSGNEIPETKKDKAGKAVTPASGIYFPILNLQTYEKEEDVSFIDIDAALFKKIAPVKQELPYLCHARKVDASLKAGNQGFYRGWVSVLIGSRLPYRSPEGVRHRAYVVSLEGYLPYLSGAEGAKQVRLITLHEWDFISKNEQYHFREIAEKLNAAPFALEKQTGSSIDAYLSNGFIPVKHVMRNGDRSVSFYRSPFTPVQVRRAVYAASDADSLYKYDPDKGVFDISYAAAWHQGRMAALSNKSLAIRIMRRRTQNLRIMHRAAVDLMIAREWNVSDGKQELGKTLIDALEKSLEDAL